VNIRDNAELRPVYLETMCNLTAGVAHEDRLLQQLEAIDALIRPEIEREVPVLWQPAGLSPLDADNAGTYAAEFERMLEFIPARLAAVRQMLAAEGIDCKKKQAEPLSASADEEGCACTVPRSHASQRNWAWLPLSVAGLCLLRRRRSSPTERTTN
jgi:MYXO-CTERM domain-containing protein